MKNKSTKLLSASLKAGIIILFLSFTPLMSGQDTENTLAEAFKNPPESAKARTWWHWTNSNVTKEGITKDLEWMKRAGIGGEADANQ